MTPETDLLRPDRVRVEEDEEGRVASAASGDSQPDRVRVEEDEEGRVASAASGAFLEAVRAAAASVPDPELPPVTLGMLGMVHDVHREGERIVVELLPTFSGCPATEMMGRDVTAAIIHRVAGVEEPDEVLVRWLFEPQWTTDLISDEGHARLKEFGIAPPTGGGVATEGPARDGRRTLPLSVDNPDADPSGAVSCPYCDGSDVVEDSPFGPTPCRASWFCHTCDQPFERFKPL